MWRAFSHSHSQGSVSFVFVLQWTIQLCRIVELENQDCWKKEVANAIVNESNHWFSFSFCPWIKYYVYVIMGVKTNKKTQKKWSNKYKKSIDCKNPKGFSQKQYCQYGRTRNQRPRNQRPRNQRTRNQNDWLRIIFK